MTFLLYEADGMISQPPYTGQWLRVQRREHVPQDPGPLRSPLQQGSLGSCSWQDEDELSHLLLEGPALACPPNSGTNAGRNIKHGNVRYGPVQLNTMSITAVAWVSNTSNIESGHLRLQRHRRYCRVCDIAFAVLDSRRQLRPTASDRRPRDHDRPRGCASGASGAAIAASAAATTVASTGTCIRRHT